MVVTRLLLILVALGAIVGVTAAQQISGGSLAMNPAGTGTMDLIIDSVPMGLSGCNITATVGNSSIATITSLTYPAWAGMNASSSLPGSSVRFVEVDLSDSVMVGATNVPVITLHMSAGVEGNTTLNIVVNRMDDDLGDPVSTTVVNGTISVSTAPTPTPTPTPTPYPTGSNNTKVIHETVGESFIRWSWPSWNFTDSGPINVYVDAVPVINGSTTDTVYSLTGLNPSEKHLIVIKNMANVTVDQKLSQTTNPSVVMYILLIVVLGLLLFLIFVQAPVVKILFAIICVILSLYIATNGWGALGALSYLGYIFAAVAGIIGALYGLNILGEGSRWW